MDLQEFLKALATGGSMGVVLGGVLWFIGRRLLGVEEALDRITKMELVRLVASPHVSPEAKEAVAEQLKDVEKAEARRTKR